ncbi:winged helix-turn-helix domain-containing protein [Nocardiopsis chromatogenes]|uniref:winged helix-turn-helix domain-containing protein n=1 Tax=Nocardiopsis chromatogenes TaxID=280239 RepID=UPI000347F9BF|nr:winged helix-turn-helix domain-containing protein [Nocardiopsis chromatogenes]
MSRARKQVVEFLDAAEEPASVAVIATVLNLGRSTVSKHLQSLEAEGRAVRAPGAREGRAKTPDLWSALTPAPAPAPVPGEADNGGATEPQEVPEGTAPDRAEVGAACGGSGPGSAPEPEGPGAEAADGGAGQAPDMPCPSGRLRAVPRAAAKPPAPGEAGWNPVSRTRRLEPGELRRMVKAVLEGAPDEEFSPTEIGHMLGRSIGAIQNCLARLAKDGEAELTSQAPRRYSAA